MSYSQYDEEPVILAALEGITNGRLLDIGAYHPTVFSNSRTLIERGWNAVLVEPSPEPFLSLLREYGNNPAITLVHAAVGAKAGLLTMHATADAVSTTDAASFEKWQRAGGFYGSFLTPVIDLDNPVFAGPFDFVNIDTEGTNLEIFSILIDRMKPRCICVEHDYQDKIMMAMAQPHGYRAVLENGTNLVLSL